jgi:AraC-like DNA-binding protein
MNPSSGLDCSALGLSDTGHFSRTFKAHYGCSPTDYRSDRIDGPAA